MLSLILLFLFIGELGIAQGTVKSRLHRIREKLARILLRVEYQAMNAIDIPLD